MSAAWDQAESYECYIGRWSSLVADRFVSWLDPSDELSWLDVGCGTGALAETIARRARPARLQGIDASEAYVAQASGRVDNPDAVFQVGDAMSLPLPDSNCDITVSGLVLNFLRDPAVGIREMERVTRPGGTVAVYVWDYADKMELIRYFWDAAVELDASAGALDEGQLFPICLPNNLKSLLEKAELTTVISTAIDVPTHFSDFDDYWEPFLGGQGPAPGYCMSLGESDRAQLRERLEERLPRNPDGSIDLIARAWAVKGSVA